MAVLRIMYLLDRMSMDLGVTGIRQTIYHLLYLPLFNATFFLILFMTIIFKCGTVSADSMCNFRVWENYKSITLYRSPTSSTYFYLSNHMAIDADGSPNAYHPDDIGLDYLANSGYPNKRWWKSILVVDPHDNRNAYVQQSGEYKGYFVSKTALQDKTLLPTNPKRYVDARNIPYIVFPRSFWKKKGTGLLGDLGYAVNLKTGDKTAFVVADIGPSRASLGEVSIALAEKLGGNNVNPRNGSGIPEGEILYVLFPYSSRVHKWPLSDAMIDNQSNLLLKEIGGLDQIHLCLKK